MKNIRRPLRIFNVIIDDAEGSNRAPVSSVAAPSLHIQGNPAVKSNRTTDVVAASDDWRRPNRTTFKAKHDELDVTRGFRAGFAVGRRKKVPRYAFMAGKMRITAWAANLGTAKALAAQEADRRAAAIGVSPPKYGWTLRVVGTTRPCAAMDAAVLQEPLST
ncbi:hypothetical protein LJR258_006553 [Rhizobium sp. LjRoot258]